jgi:hypothetical protein
LKKFFNLFTKKEYLIFIVAAFVWVLTLDVHITVVNCILLPIILIGIAKKYS